MSIQNDIMVKQRAEIEQLRKGLIYIEKICSETDNPNGENLAEGWVDMADALISEIGVTAKNALSSNSDRGKNDA